MNLTAPQPLRVATPGVTLVPLASGRWRVTGRTGALLGHIEPVDVGGSAGSLGATGSSVGSTAGASSGSAAGSTAGSSAALGERAPDGEVVFRAVRFSARERAFRVLGEFRSAEAAADALRFG